MTTKVFIAIIRAVLGMVHSPQKLHLSTQQPTPE